jgi:outer membrane receptor protein involved in Fe transport
MKPYQKLSYSIAVALGSHVATAAFAVDSDPSTSAAASGEIQEVVVTATRRTENLQDVPIAITALTSETLAQLNVQTFEDYAKYLPNLSVAAKGPGQNELYMRGLSSSIIGNQASASTASIPNVAVYLDDQSVQMPGRNLDIYVVDMERIEVLEGPQGTLYGAGAEAGAVRYITNKPALDKTEGGASASYSTTAYGAPSSSASAYLSIPLIDDVFAVRGVIYDDERGGYIHNVPGTFARSGTDLGIVDYFGGSRNGSSVTTPGVVPANSVSINNGNLVNSAYNPTTYKGIRLSADFKLNDNWNFLIEQTYQSLDADGIYAYEPSLGYLNVQQYNPSSDKDTFTDTAWTATGTVGPVKLVYTGAYLDRNINQVTDYTAYARGEYAVYYQCNGPALPHGTGTTNVCYSPSATWHDVAKNTHESHEVRVSSPDDLRLRGIFGLFYEEYKIEDSGNFYYADPQAGFPSLAPQSGTTIFDPNPRPAGISFFNDITRGYRQEAAFGDLSFDILPKQLTLSLGTRVYRMPTFEAGSTNSTYGCRNLTQAQCEGVGISTNLNALDENRTFSGHKSKVNLSWKPTPTTLLYATYSEGFRPGGFNRGTGVITSNSPLEGIFTVPLAFAPDTLKNKELGWKTQWLNRSLQFNGAIYQEDWYNVQVQIFDPTLYGNNNFGYNGPNYRVRGVEADLVYRLTEHLTLNSSVAWNSSSQQTNPTLIGNNSLPVSLVPTEGLGSTLAQCPPFQGNLRARYELPLGSYLGYAQVGAQHTAHEYASIITQGALESPRQDLPGYSTYDGAFGFKKDAWNVEFFGENLTDTHAQLFATGADFVNLVTPNRPRTLGLRMSYQF